VIVAVTDWPVVALNPPEGDHAYDEPPLADKAEDPPETTDVGDAVAAIVGKAFTVKVRTLELTVIDRFVATLL
tara:strand:+ start:480 stop:698 length:219 start_codon:yes stop_codon:yes gene_type:complete